MMIQLGDDDLVASRPLPAERSREMKGERRHVGAEGHVRRRRSEEVGDALARARDAGIGLDARRVAPVRVRIVMEEVVPHGVRDDGRNLRSAWTIEIRDGDASMLALERGKVRADLGDAGNRGHAISTPAQRSRTFTAST
jgi:hypothetical protein